ncbi:ATP-binding protein [Pedobacter sp. NJ-S-72]
MNQDPSLTPKSSKFGSEFFPPELFDTLPVAIYTCDSLGYITSYNMAAAALWGREPELKKDLWCGSWKIFEKDGSPMPLDTCPMALALKENRPITGEEIVVECPDGTKRNIIIPHPVPLYDNNGNLIGAINTLIDITDQVKSNTRIQKLLDETGLFDAKKDEFIGLVSHELKTPVTSIGAYLQLIARIFSPGDSAKTLISKAQDQLARLSTLIADLLDITELQTGLLESSIKDFNLIVIVTDVIEMMQRTNPTHELSLYSDQAELWIRADQRRMEQVIRNLISNAIKYSHHANLVMIRISAVHNVAIVSVQDFGLGIELEDQERIFTRFYRVNKLNGHPSGLGIGLYMCKEIIERHQGRLWVESTPGSGSFFFSLICLVTHNFQINLIVK